uniref:dihydrolipoyllysine-residue succinyltransferase n=1 Tax=Odontella aurita TaxID=265563 RepID=A0A7S4M6L7_9STRA|mmetsp:Transcript_12447/g.36680  ORF Transcript_12447/g.36680 Transcript_12447/m.36680 type:complete len:445 (+) Transcript_12447:82-1416(+)
MMLSRAASILARRASPAAAKVVRHQLGSASHLSSYCHINSTRSVQECNRRTFVSASASRAMPVKVVEVPTMGDSITEGTIVDLPVAPGDYVEEDDVVVVLETDKVSVDVRAPEAGAVVEILGEIDDVVEVGSGLYRMDTDAEKPEGTAAPEAAAEAPPPEPVVEPVTAAAPTPAPTTAAPAAAPTPKAVPAPVAPAGPVPGETKAFVGARTERRTKMSRMRQRVAARLKDAQNTAAMLTTFQECDMGALMELRSQHKDAFFEKHGVKLGFMSAFVKAATAALQEVPAVNAYIDDSTNEIVYRDYVDVSVAVASPAGLVVPVLRNTEAMSFADCESSIAMYARKAREGSLSLDDMSGGTFTISNGGVFGSLMGTPIINPPQSAILGMHATKMRAVVNAKGEVVARPMMYLALTYDHRLIDGREGVTFLKSISEKIADPNKLLLDI